MTLTDEATKAHLQIKVHFGASTDEGEIAAGLQMAIACIRITLAHLLACSSTQSALVEHLEWRLTIRSERSQGVRLAVREEKRSEGEGGRTSMRVTGRDWSSSGCTCDLEQLMVILEASCPWPM